MNALLYGLTVLIWGTTWLAIKWQLGVVPPPVSIAYRFGIASIVLFAILALMRRRIVPPRGAWPYLVAQGIALFCCNFLCFYYAERTVPSGMVAVIFSIAPVLNSINGRLFLGRPLQPAVVLGSLVGLAGILCLFLPELTLALPGAGGSLVGLVVAVLGTLCFSTGSLLSSRMQAIGLHPLLTNAWAMLIGAGILAIGSALAGLSFAPDPSVRYIGALLYLAVPGSVIGFTAYLMLVGRIGPERAAYCTVLFPIVALTVSTIFEGYHWTLMAAVGIVLILLGNVIAFSGNAKPRVAVRAAS